jgi:predicted GTPase
VHLKPNPEFKLLTLQSVGLGDGKISGEEKASAIKEYLKEKYEIAIEGNLVCELGKRGIVLGCVDADDPEIIIAHEILNEENFKFRTLLRFKKSSDGMLRTLGWQSGSQHGCEHPFNPVKG